MGTRIRWAVMAVCGLVIMSALGLGPAPVMAASDDSPFVSRKVEGHFLDVLASVKDVIIGRGINIAHTLPASRMLNRTGPAFGMQQNVYMDAETVEFCSARISHMLSAANPRNILLCPFTISIYVLTRDPAHVYVAYRKPVGEKNSEAAVAEVTKLLDSLVEEALSW